MEDKSMPVAKLPRLGHKDVDLHTLYKEVIGRGGVMEVINKKCWKEVASVFNFPATCTNAGYTLRINYMKLLYPYELCYFHGLSDEEIQTRLKQTGLPDQQMSNTPPKAAPDSPPAKPVTNQTATPPTQIKTPSGAIASPSLFASVSTDALPLSEIENMEVPSPTPAPVMKSTKPERPTSSPITIPARDYTVLKKRSVTLGIQSFVPAKRQCVADSELQQQRKLVALLESGNSFNIENSLRTLILISFGTEIELKESSGLLDALIRIIQRARDYPQPPQVIFAHGCDDILAFQESVDKVDSEEACSQRVYSDYLTICKSEKRTKMHRQSQALKILLNLSFIPSNKPVLAKHIGLTSILIEFIQHGKKLKWVLEILSNIGKHIRLSRNCTCLPIIIDLLYSEDWSIVMLALDFFKKNTQMPENEDVYSKMENRFFSRIVELLCIPQAIEKQFVVYVNTEMHTAREIQGMALSVLQNLALYSSISANVCQQNNCLDILMTMIDLPGFPEISRRVALTLLHFADDPANVPAIEGSLEKIILLVIRDGPSARILLNLLDKLSSTQENDTTVQPTRTVPLMFPGVGNSQPPLNK